MSTEKIKVSSAKQDIWDAYQNTLKLLNEKESVKLEPEKIRRNKRTQEVVEKTKELSLEAVQKSIESVRTKADSVLKELETQLASELEKLHLTQEAISAKDAELTQLFGISREATTFAALLEAQRVKQEQFQKDQDTARAEFDEHMAKSKKAWEDQRSEYERNYTLKVTLDQQSRDRALAEHKYNFERDNLQKTNALKDSLDAERKAWNEQREVREKVLTEREAKVTANEEAHKAATTEVETLKKLVETKVAEAIVETKGNMNASKAISENALSREHKAQVTVLEGQLASLKAENTRLTTTVATLETKLESAYDKVQAVAVQALQAQGSANTTAQVQKAVEASNAKR